MKRRFIIILLGLFLFSSLAADVSAVVVSNARDWKDVYSVMMYGLLTGEQPMFLVSERHAAVLLKRTDRQTIINIITSDQPYVIGFSNSLTSEGHVRVNEERMDHINLELGGRTNLTDFIVLDPTYGYNSIAVGSYAIRARSWVIFADRRNLDEVSDFLAERQVDSILIYGQVDREVREALSDYNMEIINEGGDRFANNVEIVKRYKEIDDAKQVLFSNGEFLELDLIGGEFPVLFIGKQAVPTVIADYVKASNIEVGVLVGNDLVGTATTIRRSLGISTFVKFARSARDPTGPINTVEGLDIYFLPVYNLGLAIESIQYNRLTNQIQVNVRNLQEVPTYFKGTYTIQAGGDTQVVGDLESLFIDDLTTKTVSYSVSPIRSEPIIADIFTLFGESKNSMELAIDTTLNVSIIDLEDDSDITIEKVVYDKKKDRFEVIFRNIGPVEAYMSSEVIDLLVDGIPRSFASDEVLNLKKGEKGRSYIDVDLTDEDIDDNPLIFVRAYYSEEPESLFKILDWKGEFGIKSFDIVSWLPLIIILILIILIIISRRKKKKHDRYHKPEHKPHEIHKPEHNAEHKPHEAHKPEHNEGHQHK